jgi:hypothetical protein
MGVIAIISASLAAASVAISVAEAASAAHRAKPLLPPLRDWQYMSGASGAPIPFGYGTVRVPGQVIWTPGINYFGLSNNGPYQGINLGPKESNAFYAPIAVAFGEGPGIINRIWGDSKLIYSANPGLISAVPVNEWPDWDSSVLYNPGNQVNFGGNVWQCIGTNTGQEPNQNASPAYWSIISEYPPYNNNTEYIAGDIVNYVGALWLCQIGNHNGTNGTHYPNSGDGQNVNSEFVLYWISLRVIYPTPTIYPGDNNQLPDSLIQASEGVALTPGYRGLIYCVFEQLLLGNFGNRIPNLRAEITYTKVATTI